MDNYTREFLIRNIGLVDTQKYDELYVRYIAEFGTGSAGTLSGILFECGAEPHLFVDKIYENFFSCANAPSIVILPADKRIEYNIFEHCKGVKYIEFTNPEMTTVTARLCAECADLETVKFANPTRSIRSAAFIDCFNLSSFDFSEATRVDDSSFAGTALTEITIPGAIHIGSFAFAGCRNLRKAVIHADNISDHAFTHCTNLSDLTFLELPSRRIDETAFENCSKLKRVKVNATIAELLDYNLNRWVPIAGIEEFICTNGTYNTRTTEVTYGS